MLINTLEVEEQVLKPAVCEEDLDTPVPSLASLPPTPTKADESASTSAQSSSQPSTTKLALDAKTPSLSIHVPNSSNRKLINILLK